MSLLLEPMDLVSSKLGILLSIHELGISLKIAPATMTEAAMTTVMLNSLKSYVLVVKTGLPKKVKHATT